MSKEKKGPNKKIKLIFQVLHDKPAGEESSCALKYAASMSLENHSLTFQ